jgi:tryptophan synthase alpha chain
MVRPVTVNPATANPATANTVTVNSVTANTVAAAFSNGRKALVGYLPAGFPTVAQAIEAATAMANSGADVIEIGLPYSDPLMDGPVIAEAVHRALTGGVKVKDVLDTVEAIAATGTPTLVMTYWNPIDQYGVRNFARDLSKAGGAGLITPDLAPEEASPWLEASDEFGLDRVFLVAPSTTKERLAAITRNCRGFVYAASLMGITGTRTAVSGDAEGLVQRTREHTDLPVAVGLGVSTAEQAAQVAAFADGVIVGSAFVRRLIDAPDPQAAVTKIQDLTRDLASGVHGITL